MSVSRQCRSLGLHRSAYYYEVRLEQEQKDLDDLTLILAVLTEIPFYGYRKIAWKLKAEHPHLTRKRVRRIMKRFGRAAIFAKRNLSKARQEHKKYPYLLGGKEIRYPNQVWASDITYLRLSSGYVYLVVILDLFSRKVLTWRLSNTADAGFCIEALEEAIELYGEPAIFNTDQGCQFTSDAFISILDAHKISISMDGKGRALDNVYVERLWRTLKYEEIYLKEYRNVQELRLGLQRYFRFYNTERFHQSLDYETPEQKYCSFIDLISHIEAA
jgi:putative transposase